MKSIQTEEAFKAAIETNQTTIAVFKADWCPDCHYINLFLADIEEKYKDTCHFIEVDVEQLPDISQELDIFGIPSFIAFHGGKELIRFVSKLRKTRVEIEQFLDRVLAVVDATSK